MDEESKNEAPEKTPNLTQRREDATIRNAFLIVIQFIINGVIYHSVRNYVVMGFFQQAQSSVLRFLDSSFIATAAFSRRWTQFGAQFLQLCETQCMLSATLCN